MLDIYTKVENSSGKIKYFIIAYIKVLMLLAALPKVLTSSMMLHINNGIVAKLLLLLRFHYFITLYCLLI